MCTKAHMRMQDEDANPIKQDTKKGKLRFYPYNINWNYGFLPQTWEDPGAKNDECGGVFGDNDPVDVVEMGSEALQMGSVHAVKCIGTYAMIDDGELDWKVIAIRTDDPLAAKINDVEDMERCAAANGLFVSFLVHMVASASPWLIGHESAEDMERCTAGGIAAVAAAALAPWALAM